MLKMQLSGPGFKAPRPAVVVPDNEDIVEENEEAVPQRVELGPELLRVLALPRRPIPVLDSLECESLAERLTAQFRLRPTGQLEPGPLRPIQAVCLKEVWEAQGGFLQVGVGWGKTALCHLLATLFQRPTLYICKGNGVGDAERNFNLYRQYWKSLPRGLFKVYSYELLSNPSSDGVLLPDGSKSEGRLERLKPKLILADEADSMANSGSAGWKRLRDYLEAHPDVVFVPMTGTPYKDSLNDAAHLMKYALKESSPLPRDFKERMSWAGALDARSGMMGYVSVGELSRLGELYGLQEPYQRDTARKALAMRILETPGVIGTQEPSVDIPLTLEPIYPAAECEELVQCFENLRMQGQLPDGTQIADPKEMARHEKCISLGFWTRMDPPPPLEWRMARNDWAKWCRKAIKHNKRKIYSEARMKAELRKGFLSKSNGLALLEAWEEAREAERLRTGLLEPNTVCEWISDECVETIRMWLNEHEGLIWVHQIGLGERLAKEFGLPYYGDGGGVDKKTGTNIRDHKGGSALASFKACSIGKNLQKFWNKNLWLDVPPNEQSLARTHRPGQEAAVVRNWLYIGCARHLEAFDRAKDKKSKFQSQLTLSEQKLWKAENSMPTPGELEAEFRGLRWQQKSMVDDEED